MKKGFDYSFIKGYEKLTIVQARELRSILMKQLGITSSVEWSKRKNNWRNIPVWAYNLITAEFANFDIDENDVWLISSIDDYENCTPTSD